ncbi:MAG: hypothetical protein U0802_26755 [Candidatus Binatia bacterium]
MALADIEDSGGRPRTAIRIVETAPALLWRATGDGVAVDETRLRRSRSRPTAASGLVRVADASGAPPSVSSILERTSWRRRWPTRRASAS